MSDEWDRHFLELARMHAQRSKDPSTKVGAVLVNDNKIVVGMGYNGFPRGVDDDPARYADRPTKLKFVVHAEVNAVINAGKEAKGATLYVWPSFALPNMCNECCKVVIQAGVKEVISYTNTGRESSTWKDSIAIAKIMCDEAGVKYRWFDEKARD